VWRYEVYVLSVAREWCVTVTDGGMRMEGIITDFMAEDAALAHGHALVDGFKRSGYTARMIVNHGGEPAVFS
jgi:hypothetical protein